MTPAAPPLLRPVENRDGPDLARLIARVFSDYPNSPFVEAEFPELKAPRDHYVGKKCGAMWVVEVEGVVVGSLAVCPTDRPDTQEIFKVYLAHAWRGSGLAQALLARAAEAARARGATRIRLWTDTRFHSGHRFYEKAGFARRPVVRFLPDSTNAWEYCFVAPLSDLAVKLPHAGAIGDARRRRLFAA
jgi:putative acetyltransferase